VFGSLPMDEVSFPVILAWQLPQTDQASYAKIKPSAEFIAQHGSSTPRNAARRYSPSTIGANS
jgi:glucoamylase